MALTILALAADLIRKQVIGSAPVTTRYTTFTGGFGMIVCGVTIASFFLSFLPGVVAMGLDALAGLLFLGGGIVSFPSPLDFVPLVGSLPHQSGLFFRWWHRMFST